MKEKIKQIVRLSLQKNRWGLYFKGKPLLEMPVQGESSVYKLNDVKISELEGAISDEIDLIFEEINRQGATECQEQTRNEDSIETQ